MIPIQEGAFDESHIVGELGEVLIETVGGRSDASEITLYKSLGIAIEDVAAVLHVYHKACETNTGTRVEFGGLRATD